MPQKGNKLIQFQPFFLVTKGINIIMIQSEEQQQSEKLILPPVTSSKLNRHIPSLQQMLNVLNRKRQEFEQQLQRQQPSDQQYNLKYARSETKKNYPDCRDMSEEESLARGSIIENSFYKRPMRKKNRLLASNITSKLQPIRSKNTLSVPKRFDTPQISQDRYKSLESGNQLRKILSKRPSTEKQVIDQQRQSDIKDYQMKILEFALPISVPPQKSLKAKLRANTQTQKQTYATKETSEIFHQKMNVQKFKELIIDLKKGSKTNDRLEKTIKVLELFNPFFRKIQRVIGVCLLRMGRIKQKLADSILYNMDEPESRFYIILHGEVKITGRFGMHKICQTGETLLEEILDLPQMKKKSMVVPVCLQKARVIVDSWILEIDKDQFRKLQKQLNKFGFRQGLNEMKTLIKRNSIVKSWLRNKFKLLQNK